MAGRSASIGVGSLLPKLPNCSGGRGCDIVVAGPHRWSAERCNGGTEKPGGAVNGGGRVNNCDEGGRDKPCPNDKGKDSAGGADEAGRPAEEAMYSNPVLKSVECCIPP